IRALTSANSVSMQYLYDKNGNLISSTDTNGIQTKYGSGACSYTDSENITHTAYPSSITRASGTSLRRSTRQTWNCATGLLLSNEDANGVVTRYDYDAIGRPTVITEAVGTGVERHTVTDYTEASTSSSSRLPVRVTITRDLERDANTQT